MWQPFNKRKSVCPSCLKMRAEKVTILVVDDDEVAVMAIRRAVTQHGIKNPVVVAGDGLEALEMLQAGTVRTPCIVLLDINMPRMTGLEFLAAIRNDPSIRTLIVFVMTTSDAPNDLVEAYSQNIAGYVLKEDAYRSIGRAIEMLGTYLEVVQFPEN